MGLRTRRARTILAWAMIEGVGPDHLTRALREAPDDLLHRRVVRHPEIRQRTEALVLVDEIGRTEADDLSLRDHRQTTERGPSAADLGHPPIVGRLPAGHVRHGVDRDLLSLRMEPLRQPVVREIGAHEEGGPHAALIRVLVTEDLVRGIVRLRGHRVVERQRDQLRRARWREATRRRRSGTEAARGATARRTVIPRKKACSRSGDILGFSGARHRHHPDH